MLAIGSRVSLRMEPQVELFSPISYTYIVPTSPNYGLEVWCPRVYSPKSLYSDPQIQIHKYHNMFLDLALWQDLGRWTLRNLPDFLRSAEHNSVMLAAPNNYVALGDRSSACPSARGVRLAQVGIGSFDCLPD